MIASALLQAAPAPEAPETGFRIMLAAGVALPVGTALDWGDGRPIGVRKVTKTGLPVGLQVWWHATEHLVLLLAAEVAPSIHTIAPYTDVSVTGLHAGVEWHFRPSGVIDPWCALGLGYEWFTSSRSFKEAVSLNPSAGVVLVQVTDTVRGPTAKLQVGLDVRVGAFDVGPFLEIAAGEYRSGSGSSSPQVPPLRPEEWSDWSMTAYHARYQLGLRAVLAL